MTTSGVQMNGMPIVKNTVQPAAQTKSGDAGKKADGGSFADMITASLSNQSSVSQAVSTKTDTSNVAAGSSKSNADTSKQTQSTGTENSIKQPKTGQIAKNDSNGKKADAALEGNGKAVETEQAVSNADTVSDETAESVEKLENAVAEAVKDILDIDEEELEKLLAEMGIGLMDLMNPQILTQFVVKAEGENDISVLLTDEQISGKLTDLMAKMQEIASENPEAVELLQTEAVLPNEELPKTFQEALVQANERNVQVDEQNEKKEAVDKNGSDDEKDGKPKFSVEVHKETEEHTEIRMERPVSSSAAVKNDQTPAEQFMNMVSNAAERQMDEVTFSELTPAQQIREIADQILERVRVNINPSQTSMEMMLNPGSLGRVSLNITSRQGVMTAQFTTQNEAAKEAIESQIVTLKETLEKQGLKVESVEVTVSNFSFTGSDSAAGQNAQSETSQRTRRNLTLDDNGGFDAELTEEENIALDMMERNGNQVDFTA